MFPCKTGTLYGLKRRAGAKDIIKIVIKKIEVKLFHNYFGLYFVITLKVCLHLI